MWSVKEVEVPSNYTFSITEDKETGIFTVTNTLKKTEIIISKQEVGGGPELPGATLIVKDENGNVIEEWISGTEPHKITLEPGVYTLTEITAPEGFEIAETITFRVNADGTTEVLQDGQWVDCNNHVTMFDARTPEVPPENPPTNTPGTPTTTTVTGKLPQTGQLWWPVPALLCAGLVSVGAGRIVATRSARK
ncbi:MAG: hypothetical protein IJ113_01305 [Eggerthellaceae bacterium]|nr:hypothetical protein [Eggerthellaceae bacterium]